MFIIWSRKWTRLLPARLPIGVGGGGGAEWNGTIDLLTHTKTAGQTWTGHCEVWGGGRSFYPNAGVILAVWLAKYTTGYPPPSALVSSKISNWSCLTAKSQALFVAGRPLTALQVSLSRLGPLLYKRPILGADPVPYSPYTHDSAWHLMMIIINN